jgi:MFS family permease
MPMIKELAERARASPYYPAISHRVLRPLLPGVMLSALGDGMSVVAISWLALSLASTGTRGLWVGAAVAAYSLPGAIGAVVLRNRMRGRASSRLAFANAVVRAVSLGAVGALAMAGLLDPAGLVALLGVSSLLSAWGMAGKYALIADVLPPEHRVAGNTVFGLADQVSLMVGPALAGLLTAAAGPAAVIATDAATWVLLAISYARVPARDTMPAADTLPGADAMPAGRLAGTTPAPTPQDHAGSGWAVIRRNPTLVGVLALSFVFYLLYGPVEVALPVHVAGDLHGSAAVLGLFWAVFGAGAIAGELAAPFLRRFPVWPVMILIVLGWGAALLPLGLSVPEWVALVAFCAGAVIWGPWTSLSMAVFQDASPLESLAQVLAARSSLLIVASPLGTALGGPLVAGLGARGTMLVSSLGTVAVGAIAAWWFLRPHRFLRAFTNGVLNLHVTC